MNSGHFVCSLLVIVSFLAPKTQADSPAPVHTATLRGRVVDSLTGQPLSWATLELEGTRRRLKADSDGRFEFTNLQPDTCTLRVSRVGYEVKLVSGLILVAGSTTTVAIELVPKETTVKSIVVTPGRYTIMGNDPVAHQTFSRAELTTMPQLGDDFFRATRRLPGMAGTDYSARFDVRGGEYREVLVTLDGLAIAEPFHMRDIDGGAVSAVDASVVASVDFMTGGFPAKYGDKMSGVFNIRTRSLPVDSTMLQAGFSFAGFRAMGTGNFEQGRGTWLFSARRGFIDWVLALVGASEGMKPRYYDLFGKVSYRLGASQIINLDMLHANDNMRFHEDEPDTLISSYGTSHVWANLHSSWNSQLTSSSIISFSHDRHNRRGQEVDFGPDYPEHITSDKEHSSIFGLRTDWQYEASDRLLLEFGLQGQALSADQDFYRRSFTYELQWLGDHWGPVLSGIDTTQIHITPKGNKFAAYISARFTIGPKLVAETGWRHDHNSYTDDDVGAPRIGLVYEINPQTSLRGSWGKYYQTEGIDEISIVDGEDEFYPADRAEQYGVGLEHQFESGTHLRVESYLKEYRSPRPDYRNSVDRVELWPEHRYDRQSVFLENSVAKGVEIYLKRDTGGKVSWYCNYAYAGVEDSVKSIYFPRTRTEVIYNRKMPSSRDIRHTLYLDIVYRPTKAWQFNLAFQYHAGWLYTAPRLERVEVSPGTFINYVVADEEWNARYAPFHRLDFRANRFYGLAGGRLNFFVDILNVYNRQNVRGFSYLVDETGDEAKLLVSPNDYWFGIMPSFGFSYEVEF